MKTLKIIFGVLFALAAVVSFGLGAFLSLTGYMSLRAHQHDFGFTQGGIILGGVPALIMGVIAWLLLRSAPKSNGENP